MFTWGAWARPRSMACASSSGGRPANLRARARMRASASSDLAAHVGAGQLGAQRDFIAPRRGKQMRVGVAADIAQERLMIDAATHVLVELGDIGQPHAQHAGPQRKISRVARGQVGRIGQRHQKIGAPNRAMTACKTPSACRITVSP